MKHVEPLELLGLRSIYSKNQGGLLPSVSVLLLSSASCLIEAMLTFNSKPINNTTELKYINNISMRIVLIEPYSLL